MKITQIGSDRYRVGEGPLWDVERRELLFVDIVGQRLAILDSENAVIADLAMPMPVVAATRTTDGRLLAVLADGFYTVDEATGACSAIGDFRTPDGVTLNDAKVDREGRLVAVGADKAMKAPVAAIYRLHPDGRVDLLDDGFTLGNGPSWSPDGRVFFVADSIERKIFAYDYSNEGTLSRKRLFADTADLGMPDGATVDADGFLWMAMCGSGKVVRFAQKGVVERSIELPTLWGASVAFGGTALDRLYVTTLDPAVVGLVGDDLCGALFLVDGLGVAGIAERRVVVTASAAAGDHKSSVSTEAVA